MIDIEELNRKLSALQSSSLNCGGTWEVRTFSKENPTEPARAVLIKEFKNSEKYDNLEKYENSRLKGGWNAEEFRMTKNLELIPLPDWEKYVAERIKHWSEFELISKNEMMAAFDQHVYQSKLEEFLACLKNINLNNDLCSVSKINEDKFDTYDLWKEQICEDFIFEYPNQIITLSFGWSS